MFVASEAAPLSSMMESLPLSKSSSLLYRMSYRSDIEPGSFWLIHQTVVRSSSSRGHRRLGEIQPWQWLPASTGAAFAFGENSVGSVQSGSGNLRNQSRRESDSIKVLRERMPSPTTKGNCFRVCRRCASLLVGKPDRKRLILRTFHISLQDQRRGYLSNVLLHLVERFDFLNPAPLCAVSGFRTNGKRIACCNRSLER